jgi:hypothetical protein
LTLVSLLAYGVAVFAKAGAGRSHAPDRWTPFLLQVSYCFQQMAKLRSF